MIYPPAALQFFANSLRGVLPINIYSEHAGRGRFIGGGGVGAGRGNPPANVAAGRGAPISTPAPTAKRPSSGAGASLSTAAAKRSRSKGPTPPTRRSPRLHVAAAASAAPAAAAPRPTPRRLHPIAEQDDEESAGNKSPVLLDESQEVPGTEFPPMYVNPNGAVDPTSQLTDYGNYYGNYQAEEDVDEYVEQEEEAEDPQFQQQEPLLSPHQESNEVGRFDEILTESAYDKKFPERLEQFLGHSKITETNRLAVEICLIAQAGIAISEDTTLSNSQLKARIVDEYKQVISTVPSHLFISDDLRKNMHCRLKGAKRPKYGVEFMWNTWLELKSEMKRIFTGVPKNFHTMLSGNQLHTVFKQIIRDHWIEANVSIHFNRVYIHDMLYLKTLLYSEKNC